MTKYRYRRHPAPSFEKILLASLACIPGKLSQQERTAASCRNRAQRLERGQFRGGHSDQRDDHWCNQQQSWIEAGLSFIAIRDEIDWIHSGAPKFIFC